MVSDKLPLWNIPWSLKLILGKNGAFLFFEEFYCYCHYTDEQDSAKQALSAVIDVLKTTENKIKCCKGNNDPKFLLWEMRFP